MLINTSVKSCIIPQRFIFGVMGFLATINAYTLRNCLSVAITEMVTSTDSNSAVDKKDTKEWTEVQQGLVLGSFYIGYIATHIPGGLVAERWGAKHVLNGGLLITTVLTLLTPLTVEILDWQGLLVVRVIEGLAQGTTFPALSVLLAHWVPLKDRAKMGSLVFAGTQMGTVIAYIASGYIIEATGSWASVFYFYGFWGMLWCITWQLVGFSDPSTHPYIKDTEREYLEKEVTSLSKKKQPTPWRAILTSLPVWAQVIGQIGHTWILFAMVADLPKYIKVALNFTVGKNGLFSSMPYFVMWVCSILSGFVADWLINKHYLSVTLTRKIFTVVSAVLPAVFIVIASYAGRDKVLVISFFVIGMATMGPFYSGLRLNPIDVSPNFSGTIMAMTNGLGSVSGALTPYIIGVIISQEGDPILLWRLVFWITLGVAIGTSIIYYIFATAEVQIWNIPDDYNAKREADRLAKEEKKQAKRAAREAKAAEKQAEREAKIRARQNAT